MRTAGGNAGGAVSTIRDSAGCRFTGTCRGEWVAGSISGAGAYWTPDVWIVAAAIPPLGSIAVSSEIADGTPSPGLPSALLPSSWSSPIRSASIPAAARTASTSATLRSTGPQIMAPLSTSPREPCGASHHLLSWPGKPKQRRAARPPRGPAFQCAGFSVSSVVVAS